MFKWLRKRRIDKCVLQAQEYINNNLLDEKKSRVVEHKLPADWFKKDDDGGKIQYSTRPRPSPRPEDGNEGKVQYSTRPRPEGDSGEKIQYSSRPRPYPRPEDDSQGKVQYSYRDTYNPDTAYSMMRNITRGQDVSRSLAGLEDSINMTFVDKLLDIMKRRQLSNVEVYRMAQIDRRLFSKIVSDRTYRPSKDTCIAIALALCLNIDDAKDLLSRAGYTLSHSVKRDVAIEFFFKEAIYDVIDANEILDRLGATPLGRI